MKNNKTMLNLNELGYVPADETGFGSIETYRPVYNALETLISPKSVADLGCRVGYLISLFKSNNIPVIGFDVFEYNKEACQDNIKEDFFIHDLRNPIPEQHTLTKYDLIVSTEVGEHIDPDYSIDYLNNIKSLMHDTSKLLISWSPDGSDAQHVHALSKEDFHKHMINNGFSICDELTNEFLTIGNTNGIRDNLPWYFSGNISIWKIL